MGTSHLGYRADGVRLASWEYVLAGGASSCGTRAICQPLDVLKIRLQLQVEPKHEAKYRSVRQAVLFIGREEGVWAFWKGHGPAQYLSLTYGVCQFSAFEMGTKWLGETLPWTAEDAFRPSVHFVIGGWAGIAGTLLSYPFDVIRTRLVAQGRARQYRHTWDAARQMAAQEGGRAFFRGLIPTFATVAPYSGLQFGFYSLFVQLSEKVTPRMARSVPESLEHAEPASISMLSSLTSGALAGLCAKIAVFPFDVTKKRLQVQGFEHGRAALGRTWAYSGMVDCLTSTFRSEGVRGLFRGLSPGLIKAVVTTSINFWLYEFFCERLALRHESVASDEAG